MVLFPKPSRLQWIEIRKKAEEFREKSVTPVDKIPIPIEEIVEFDLEITPWPINGLLKKIDIDGFLSRDLKNIFIDAEIYNDPRQENRLRFTYAHEIGHLILHKNVIKECEFRTENEWIKFREDMSEDDLFWFEQQAYEFAGRLLVPKGKLIQELKSQIPKIDQFREVYDEDYNDLLIKAISRIICTKFKVSEYVLYRRIKNENVWEVINH